MYILQTPINIECITLHIQFWVLKLPPLPVLWILASASQATTQAPSHMHPASTPHIYFNPCVILSVSCNICFWRVKSPTPTHSVDPHFLHIEYLTYNSPYIPHTWPYT